MQFQQMITCKMKFEHVVCTFSYEISRMVKLELLDKVKPTLFSVLLSTVKLIFTLFYFGLNFQQSSSIGETIVCHMERKNEQIVEKNKTQKADSQSHI